MSREKKSDKLHAISLRGQYGARSGRCGRFLHESIPCQDALGLHKVKIRIANRKNKAVVNDKGSNQDSRCYISKKGVPIEVGNEQEGSNEMDNENLELIVVKYLGGLAQVLRCIKNRDMLLKTAVLH